MQGKENILKDLDYLKVIGILLVVIGHCTSIYTGGWVYKSPVNAPIYGLIASYVYTFHVPMLVFVSGAIYYYCRKNKEKYKSLKGLVSNKFKRLIVPFLTIGLFYSIPIKYLIGNIEKGTLLNSIRNFLIGLNTGHLWYLLMLFDIFILFYLYEKFIINKKYSVSLNIIVFTLLYIFSGILFSVIGAFILYFITGAYGIGSLFNTYYISLSVFLAYALSYPDMNIYLWFVIPIKMKWMAVVYGAFIIYDMGTYVRSGQWYMAVPIVASLLNFALFFFSTRNMHRYNPKEVKRRKEFKKAVASSRVNPATGGITKHKCAICGRTEKDDPNLEFRFCSKCNGNYEYCQDHLFTHQHVK